MRVAIAGGHGKIALLLTKELEAVGDEVVSLIRNPDHAADVETAGGEPRIVDLEEASAEQIAAEIGTADAIVFAAGAGPGSGLERKETVDYAAATKMVEVGKALDVKRFLMISSMAANAGNAGDDVFDVYLRAKGRADDVLRKSGLTYVIVRPGRLTDEPGTGMVELGESVDRGEIPRADVATVLGQCLRAEAIADRILEVVAGETPIAEAVTWAGDPGLARPGASGLDEAGIPRA
jgi:nucleoside-diphosphate-sugar epimerase